MAPPTEPSRVVASELRKGGKNLEGTGAKFLCPSCFQVFFNNFGGTPTYIFMIFGNLKIGKKNLERLPISNFVYEGASNAPQEHVKVVLQLHYVGGMQSTGSTVQGCMSPCLHVLQLTRHGCSCL